MRQLVSSRRWLATHALMIVVILGFLGLGYWQLMRAEAGNARSYAYMLEWPTFALLVLGFWIKIIRDELRKHKTGSDHGDAGEARRQPVDASQAAVADDDLELAAYNRYLANLHSERSRR